MKIHEESEQLDQFEEDTITATLQKLASTLDRFSSNDITFESPLIRLITETGGAFPVSRLSLYNSEKWEFESKRRGRRTIASFDCSLPGLDSLKRALVFFLLPQNSFNQAKSFMTTLHHARHFKFLETFIFAQNHLTGSPKHIGLVTATIINQALDKVRDEQKKTSYLGLFVTLQLWASLSIQQQIPESLRLKVHPSTFDTVERRADVIRIQTEILQSWTPYSETELAQFMEFSFFWIEKALPAALDLKTRIISSGVIELSKPGSIHRNSRDQQLEEMFNIEIDGKTIMTLNSSTNKGKILYTWFGTYGVLLNQIRNAIFILVALLTGARASELSPLTPGNLRNEKEDGSGDYWLTITRWKTSEDPDYEGESEEIPLPRFVAKAILDFDSLKIAKFRKAQFIFQSNVGKRSDIRATPYTLYNIITQLAEQLPIEQVLCHRFRKTIAEILINRDERNIDIIRALFGHKSYEMTLKYISRNPALVRCVSDVLEECFTTDFQQIVKEIGTGHYSGDIADRIAVQISNEPNNFKGSQLRITLRKYISHILESGAPLFIKRTAVGTYCLSSENYTTTNHPPCINEEHLHKHNIKPEPANCQYSCNKIIVFEKARSALQDNISFYSRILEDLSNSLPANSVRELRSKIHFYKLHLDNVLMTRKLPLQEVFDE